MAGTESKGNSDNFDIELGRIISRNLKKLITNKHLTQKKLAQELEVTPASMTEYCKGESIPKVRSLVRLKELYNISLDDFLTKNYSSAITAPREQGTFEQTMVNACRKFCGSYFVYYLNTSSFKGLDTAPPDKSLIYGVLYIYETSSALDKRDFNCAAVLGISEREAARKLKRDLDKIQDSSEIINTIEYNYSETAYFGDLKLSQDNTFISMSHSTIDRALIILPRVDSNKPHYLGGIGTINSISKGRSHTPVVQFIGASRYPLTMSEEEIHHCLLLDYPTFRADAETDELIKTLKNLYANPEAMEKLELTDYQKTVLVRSMLERYVKKSLERNVFRYGKITGRDDDIWYSTIQAAKDKEY